MNKEFVQQYAKLERAHWWFVVRQKIILQFLKKHLDKKPVSILNIGAASGTSTQWLSGLGDVTSVETEPFFIQYLKEQQINVTEASVTAMPFVDNSFDLVCAFDVIEHVENDIAAMNEMKRICRPGGLICVTVPAGKMLWSSHDVINGHLRRYTKRSLAYLGNSFPLLNRLEIKYFNSLLFIPILVARKVSGKSKARESDFSYFNTGNFTNKILKAIFSAELWLLRIISFPFGVSLIAFWKKSMNNK